MAGEGGAKKPKTLDEWVELLRHEEMPIFSYTAQRIYAAMDDKKTGAMELGAVILQDPNLTAKLLRVSNTPYYNPSRQKIGTVSRAIVILGMEMIRELTLACSYFEAILSNTNKERANREIALAIHSAVQARELATLVGDVSPEEVFVAALLNNIGHIAFWCSAHKWIVPMQEAIAQHGSDDHAEAEKAVLGFGLDDLAKRLCHSWRLGGLIEDAINYPSAFDRRIRMVKFGRQICDAIKQGWDSNAMRNCLQNLEKFSGHTVERLKELLNASTYNAVEIAHQFGAHDASQYITRDPVPQALETAEEIPLDKKQIQFQVLHEITLHISGGEIDLNVLFEMVLEGIHRGVAMDRTLFMLVSSDKKALSEKISLGWHKEVGQTIRILDNEPTHNLLFQALHEHDGLWGKPKQHEHLYSAQIEAVLGKHECFAFPLLIGDKPVGLIYCDRGVSRGDFALDDFSVANHFVKQAQIGLALYRMKHH